MLKVLQFINDIDKKIKLLCAKCKQEQQKQKWTDRQI